jgi:hypothetical protein
LAGDAALTTTTTAAAGPAAEGSSASFKHRLAQPLSWSRSEVTVMQGLPLPAGLQGLLLLHHHLETCYSFLLQQHIQPRWGRLLDLMGSLFPQVISGGGDRRGGGWGGGSGGLHNEHAACSASL